MNLLPGVPAYLLCMPHKCSVHNEVHKILIPNLRSGKSIDGYVRKGLIYVPDAVARHDEVAAYLNHKSPLLPADIELINQYLRNGGYPGYIPEAAIEAQAVRCPKCAEIIRRYQS